VNYFVRQILIKLAGNVNNGKNRIFPFVLFFKMNTSEMFALLHFQDFFNRACILGTV
jgi:hypothetical protein